MAARESFPLGVPVAMLVEKGGSVEFFPTYNNTAPCLQVTLGTEENSPCMSTIHNTLLWSFRLIDHLFFSWHSFLNQEYVYGPLAAGLKRTARQQGLVIQTRHLATGLLDPLPKAPTNYHEYPRLAADPRPIRQSPTVAQCHHRITFLNMCMEGLFVDESIRIAIVPGQLNLSDPYSADMIMRFLGEIKKLAQYLPGALKIIVTIRVGQHRVPESVDFIHRASSPLYRDGGKCDWNMIRMGEFIPLTPRQVPVTYRLHGLEITRFFMRQQDRFWVMFA